MQKQTGQRANTCADASAPAHMTFLYPRTQAPRDKIICVYNCCKVLNQVLLSARLEEAQHGRALPSAGADELLPMLIYAIMQVHHTVCCSVQCLSGCVQCMSPSTCHLMHCLLSKAFYVQKHNGMSISISKSVVMVVFIAVKVMFVMIKVHSPRAWWYSFICMAAHLSPCQQLCARATAHESDGNALMMGGLSSTRAKV
jgi:hypothetical protein